MCIGVLMTPSETTIVLNSLCLLVFLSASNGCWIGNMYVVHIHNTFLYITWNVIQSMLKTCTMPVVNVNKVGVGCVFVGLILSAYWLQLERVAVRSWQMILIREWVRCAGLCNTLIWNHYTLLTFKTTITRANDSMQVNFGSKFLCATEKPKSYQWVNLVSASYCTY